MNEKNEKYPQLILGTDGMYEIFISESVKVKFESEESLNEFIKDKNFNINGIKMDRINNLISAEKYNIWETLNLMRK